MIDRYQIVSMSPDWPPAPVILGGTKILAAHRPSRRLLIQIVDSGGLPPFIDYVARTVLAYPWRMGAEHNDRSLACVAALYATDGLARLHLPMAALSYAEAIEADEARRGKQCRMYVPHMENWLEGGSWCNMIENSRATGGGTMGATERAYEQIKRARGAGQGH